MSKEKILTIVDKDSPIKYEKKKLVHFFMIPITIILASWVAIKKKILGPNLKINTFWFDGISPICREVKENATRWKALDIIYNYSPPENPNLIDNITTFWNNLLSSCATRNRLRLVKYHLAKEIENYLNNFSEVRLISVASGSAQGVIEVMKDFKDKPIKAIFLDLDQTALEHSKKLAEKAGVKDKIIFSYRSARDLKEIIEEFKPHIVEVVGFLMYRPGEKAINLVKRIYQSLPQDSVLLISNDNHVFEKFFLHYVLNWSIIYRLPSEFIEILIKGGFNPEHCKIIYEPLKMHGLAICRKVI